MDLSLQTCGKATASWSGAVGVMYLVKDTHHNVVFLFGFPDDRGCMVSLALVLYQTFKVKQMHFQMHSNAAAHHSALLRIPHS